MADFVYDDDAVRVFKAWQPDVRLITAGDEAAVVTLRCYAAAGLSNWRSTARLLWIANVDADIEPHDLAVALAHHCAFGGLSFANIVAILCRLAVEVPLWPNNPEEITSIAADAVERWRP
jgi:hypothetical protein